MLLLTSPNIRGDDVADLQASLARLGFDCGRVDGIFGPITARALADFQSNCGLVADGICGVDTVRSISRVIGQTGTGPGVVAVRERERLRHAPTSLHMLRAVVGGFGAVSAITRAVARELRAAGATVMILDEPDPVAQALTANRFAAHVYVGFEPTTGDRSVVHFYRVPAFESLGGRTLARCLSDELAATDLVVDEPSGMRLPVLRETKMPAVLCSVAPVRTAVDSATQIADALVSAIEMWIELCTLPVT